MARDALDPELEKALDEVGRYQAFTLAKAYGWTCAPPKWVWWNIIAALKATGATAGKPYGQTRH